MGHKTTITVKIDETGKVIALKSTSDADPTLEKELIGRTDYEVISFQEE